MEWQPIETAPRDGTEILAYRRDAGVFTIHFVAPADMIVSDDEEPCWFSLNGDDLTDDMPTHWMPLPKPPRTASATRDYVKEAGGPSPG